MKNTTNNNIIIIGCSISSLYAAIKCLDLGYNVCILETKKCISQIFHHSNMKIYNDNHKLYINLCKIIFVYFKTFTHWHKQRCYWKF